MQHRLTFLHPRRLVGPSTRVSPSPCLAARAEMADDAMALVAVAPATVDNALIVSRLRELLAVADLQCTTERQLRQMLEEELGVSLAEKKAFIREQAHPLNAAPITLSDALHLRHRRWRRC